MDATCTTSRRQTSRTLIVALLLCVMAIVASALLARQIDIIKIGDWVANRQRTKSIVLFHAPAGTTGRVEGWIGGMWISVEDKLKIIGGGNELDLRSSPTGLTGTANGMPVNCRNLTIESGTGRLTVDDPELLARIGTAFELRVDP